MTQSFSARNDLGTRTAPSRFQRQVLQVLITTQVIFSIKCSRCRQALIRFQLQGLQLLAGNQSFSASSTPVLSHFQLEVLQVLVNTPSFYRVEYCRAAPVQSILAATAASILDPISILVARRSRAPSPPPGW